MTQVAAVMAGPAIVSPSTTLAFGELLERGRGVVVTTRCRHGKKKPLGEGFLVATPLPPLKLLAVGQDWLSALSDKIILPENQKLGNLTSPITTGQLLNIFLDQSFCIPAWDLSEQG